MCLDLSACKELLICNNEFNNIIFFDLFSKANTFNREELFQLSKTILPAFIGIIQFPILLVLLEKENNKIIASIGIILNLYLITYFLLYYFLGEKYYFFSSIIILSLLFFIKNNEKSTINKIKSNALFFDSIFLTSLFLIIFISILGVILGFDRHQTLMYGAIIYSKIQLIIYIYIKKIKNY
jgi:hypothetical protein